MNKVRTTISAILLSTLTGCAMMPMDPPLPQRAEMLDDIRTDWNDIPAVTVSSAVTGVMLSNPLDLPSRIAAYPIHMQLKPNETMPVKALAGVLGELGISVGVASSELAEQRLNIPLYKGPLGEFLRAIEGMNDVAFEWRNGLILINTTSPYIVTLPQDEELVSQVADRLSKMGAQDVTTSLAAGMVTYRASAASQQFIKPYLDRTAKNAALVNLQIAVVTVGIDRTRNQGFDWGSLQFALSNAGTGGVLGGVTNTLLPGTEAVTDTVTRGVHSQLITVDSGGLGAKFTRSRFNFNGLIKLLSTYGSTRTDQNVTLKTMPGTEVVLESGQRVPYVSSVTQTNAVTDRTDSLTNSRNIEFVETGLKLKIKPQYDAEGGLVTLSVDMSLTNLLGFIDNGDESYSPNTQNQIFNNMVRLEAGETTVLGGIVYDSLSDSRASITGMDRFRTASKDLKTTRNMLFIVLRPTVTVYAQNMEGKQ